MTTLKRGSAGKSGLVLTLLALLALFSPLTVHASTVTPIGPAHTLTVHLDCLGLDVQAGTYNATVDPDGGTREVYCVDLHHPMCFNEPHQQGPNLTQGQVVWILNHYYPAVPGEPSSLSNADERAAAVQLAIWYYTDGCDFGNDTAVKNAAWDIVRAAEGQEAATAHTPASLTLAPKSALNLLPGASTHTVTAQVQDQNGAPLDGQTITFTVQRQGQKIASGQATTGAAGPGRASFTYTNPGGEGTDTITARVDYTIPVGLRWVHEDYQQLVLAKSTNGSLSATASKQWAYPSATPTNTATPTATPAATPTLAGNPATGDRACLDTDFGFVPLLGGGCGCPGYLLFQSTRDGQPEVYIQDPGLSGAAANISHNAATDRDPARSPGGQWIAYETDRFGSYWQLYLVSANSQAEERLTNVAADTLDPQWSPDCKDGLIAYQSNEHGNWDIYVLSLSTLSSRPLTTSLSDDVNPNWSPDGREIAFETNRVPGHWQIWIMNADGTGQRPLIAGAGDARNPVWSPDGARMAFESNRANGCWQVYVYDMASGAIVNVSRSRGYSVKPSWSPDGTRLVYQSSHWGGWDVYMANADGAGQTLIAGSWVREENPVWSCDGRWIVYQAQDGEGQWGLYAVHPDGSARQRITQGSVGADTVPLWDAPENDNARLILPPGPPYSD